MKNSTMASPKPFAGFTSELFLAPTIHPSYKCRITLTKKDYYTIPSLEECDQYYYNRLDETCVLKSFTVGRTGYGAITWNGPIDVQGLDLDEIVHIERSNVIVYPNDDHKPPVGHGLNRPAEIILVQIWPVEKSPSNLFQFSKVLEDITIKMDAKFKYYCPKTGLWIFQVKHFSKYGLDDAAAEDENDVQPFQGARNAPGNQKPVPDQKVTFVKELMPFDNENSLAITADLKDSGTIDDNVMDTNVPDDRTMKVDGLEKHIQNDDMDYIEYKLKTDDQYRIIITTLFGNDETETVSKKCKNLSFTKSQASSHQKVNSTLFPLKFKSSIPQKRRLQFDPKPSNLKANVYSFNYSKFPKVRFANASHTFCLIDRNGGDVGVYKFDSLKLDQTAVEKLELQLTVNSSIEKAEDPEIAPLIKTNSYSLNTKADSNINSLIDALFGELSEKSSYARHQERLRRILKWLFNHNQTLPVPRGSYGRIMHFLTTNELEFAVTECINYKLPRLSYLISCGPYVNKELIKVQLNFWKKMKVDSTFNQDLLKIYVVLSGLSTWTTSDGKLIQPLIGLHWTQQLSLLLLYKTRTDVDVIGTNLVKEATEELSYKPDDVEYHLLAQNPPSMTMAASSNYLDSWFLQEALLSYNVIKSNPMTNKCDSTNLFMASQTNDLRWALFFAMHVKDDFYRTFWVRELLMKNVAMLNQELELYLVEEYLLNPIFLSEAKFYLAKTNRDYKAMALNLLALRKFKQAHDLLVDKIFPELVINDEYQELELLIGKLMPHRHEISNWNSFGAGIYATFLQLLQFGKSQQDLEYYRQLVADFKVYQLQCPTPRHALCQSQMAHVANIINSELTNGLFPYNSVVSYDFSLLELKSNGCMLSQLKAN